MDKYEYQQYMQQCITHSTPYVTYASSAISYSYTPIPENMYNKLSSDINKLNSRYS